MFTRTKAALERLLPSRHDELILVLDEGVVTFTGDHVHEAGGGARFMIDVDRVTDGSLPGLEDADWLCIRFETRPNITSHRVLNTIVGARAQHLSYDADRSDAETVVLVAEPLPQDRERVDDSGVPNVGEVYSP